jgi:hypothetical protein
MMQKASEEVIQRITFLYVLHNTISWKELRGL